jgi:hypothetical protein
MDLARHSCNQNLEPQMHADKRKYIFISSALLTVRFFSNRKEIFKLPFSRSAASRLGKSGLNLSLVAACRAAFMCDFIIISHREGIFTLAGQADLDDYIR